MENKKQAESGEREYGACHANPSHVAVEGIGPTAKSEITEKYERNCRQSPRWPRMASSADKANSSDGEPIDQPEKKVVFAGRKNDCKAKRTIFNQAFKYWAVENFRTTFSRMI